VLIPKENRKDLRDVPRRVLKLLRIVLVDHVDDVLREALVLDDPDAVLGPPRTRIEYRDGEPHVIEGPDLSSDEERRPSVSAPSVAEQPGA
jgi:ATP-dependent Lon protease